MKIYAVKIKKQLDLAIFNSLTSYISNERNEKIKYYKYKIDADRALIAEILCRVAIIENLNIKNSDIYFDIHEYGKPYLKFHKDFHFNLSHSGDWVVCAIDDKHIGIDIEKVEILDLDISRNFFASDEYQDLLSQNPNNQLSYFYDLWTIKESYIKAYGKGLSLDLHSFSVGIKNENIILKKGSALKNCFFKQYDIEEGYKIAVCALNPSFPKNIILKTIDDLYKILHD